MALSPSPASGAEEFSVRSCRDLVTDLSRPRPALYWADLLVSLAVGYGALWLGLAAGRNYQPVALALAVVALFRAASFIHELAHLPRRSFGAFRFAWNLLCGVPFLLPSFLYHTHTAHHLQRSYGTDHDGEYLPWATGPRRDIALTLVSAPIVPLLAVLRFGLLSPLSWAVPAFGEWVQRHASALVVNPRYVRPAPTPAELRVWRWQEAACLAYLVGAGVLVAAGVVDLDTLLVFWAVATLAVLLNSLRLLASHRYRSRHREMTWEEQMLDSVNHPRGWLATVWAPAGLRFHALHHLLPGLPYHSLGTAHRRLMENLPADSPYRETNSSGLLASLRTLWLDAGNQDRFTALDVGRQ